MNLSGYYNNFYMFSLSTVMLVHYYFFHLNKKQPKKHLQLKNSKPQKYFKTKPVSFP